MRFGSSVALAFVLASAVARAEGEGEPAPSATEPPAESKPGVALDQLLTLPEDRTYAVDRKGGMTRGEWRTRYGEVRADLQKERAALAVTQDKLDDASGAQWSVNPIPGAESDPSKSPVDFQLRTELRRHREEIERLERKLRQLDIEANLAGVPEEWRR
ncbi:MAG TPA: hypothetical protein VFT98_21150 [Myxococcota bacterium]|nr:hypothetical protein [Myxococcota bacterium]